ncbi:hypothetical protein [Nostoc sp.]
MVFFGLTRLTAKAIALKNIINIIQLQVFANCAIAPLMKPRLPLPH